MTIEFQLKEQRWDVSRNAYITFSKPSGSILRQASSTTSVDKGYIFVVTSRSFIDGKYVRFRWQGYGSHSHAIVQLAAIYDGAYYRSVANDFLVGTTVGFKGNGLLQTLHNPSTSTFAAVTIDSLIDVSGGSQDLCTIMFIKYDPWLAQSFWQDIDWFEVNSSSGGSGNLYSEDFDGSITMEVTGGNYDYGYISTGALPEEGGFAHSQAIMC